MVRLIILTVSLKPLFWLIVNKNMIVFHKVKDNLFVTYALSNATEQDHMPASALAGNAQILTGLPVW